MNLILAGLKEVKLAWKSSWNSAFAINLIITVLFGVFLLIVVPGYLEYIQQRKGTLLNDWLLAYLPSIDLSWYIFPVMYFCLFFAIYQLSYKPALLVLALQTYLVTSTIRLIAMFLLPLEEPVGLVLLIDPVNQKMIYGGNIITKDLFFSGHVATMVIFFLSGQTRLSKYIFFLGIFAVALMILIQHAHYTIDVVTAPFVTYITYRFLLKMNKRILPPSEF
jgi:hypothetical protein